MYIKNQLKKRLYMSIATVFVLVITIISSSYALFMDVSSDINAQVMQVGNLQITYTGSSAINIENITPMLDQTAYLESNNLYTFTVDNIGDVPYNFTISLIDNSAYSTSNLLNHNYIRYDLNSLGANSLGAQTDGKIFETVLEPGAARLYNLRLWVADATIYQLPNEALGSEIHLNIKIEGKAGTI